MAALILLSGRQKLFRTYRQRNGGELLYEFLLLARAQALGDGLSSINSTGACPSALYRSQYFACACTHPLPDTYNYRGIENGCEYLKRRIFSNLREIILSN